MTRDDESKILPLAGLMLAMILWGGSYIALKLAFRTLDPMVVIFGRMAIGAAFFLCFKGRLKGVTYRKGDWRMLVLMALFEPCLYFIFESLALTKTSASQAGMIVAMLPLLVAVAARFFLKEHISKRTITGFFLAIFGACWLSIGGEATDASPDPILGNFLELMAMASAVGYIILMKKLTLKYPPFLITGVQAMVGSMFYFPLLFLPSTDLPTTFDPTGFAAVVYLGLFVTMGAYGLFNYGVSRIPASQATAFTNLIPVLTVIMAGVILGETFTRMQYIASTIVLSGVILSQEHAINWRGLQRALARLSGYLHGRRLASRRTGH